MDFRFRVVPPREAAALEQARVREAVRLSTETHAIHQAVLANHFDNNTRAALVMDEEWQVFFLLRDSLEEARVR